MTTTASSTDAASTHADHPGQLSFARILNSEWIKLRSLRSTVWSYAIMVVISLGMAALMSLSLQLGPGALPAEEQTRFLVQASTFGVFFGQLIVAVLGVLIISGEYSTGMIRSTLTAVPKRLPALLAKALVLFVTTFVVGLASTVGAFLMASPILAGKGLQANLFDSDVLLPFLAAALYLALVSVFALGLGAILRSSAGGISAALGTILLLPIVVLMIPAQWARDTVPYLLMNAGLGSFGLDAFGGPSPLEAWQQILVIIAWALATLVIGAALLKRRDA